MAHLNTWDLHSGPLPNGAGITPTDFAVCRLVPRIIYFAAISQHMGKLTCRISTSSTKLQLVRGKLGTLTWKLTLSDKL